MNEELITFETAKLAYKKGFYGYDYSKKVYDNSKLINKPSMSMGTWSDFEDRYIPAPTQALLQKWLREVHEIFVEPNFDHMALFDINISHFKLQKTYEYKSLLLGEICFFNYEQALEFGLKTALELLP